jgi:hypothetical protein
MEGVIMDLLRLLPAVLLAAAALPALAQDTGTGAIVGKVVNIYVRESTNFYIETGLLRHAAGKQHWTEVRFAAPLADGRTSELVRLPDARAVERGDIVRAQLVDSRPFVPGLIPEVNRMVALVAKHDTIAAMMFDLPKPAPGTASQFLQAAH